MRIVIACLPCVSVGVAVVCLPGHARRRRRSADCAVELSGAWRRTPPSAAPDYWSGLSVGAGISVWGGKGVKGGVGGETDLNYEHVFDNGIMLGVQASTGYMPYLQTSPGFSQFTGGAFAGGLGDRRLQFRPGDALRDNRRRFRPFDALQQRRLQPKRRHQHRLLRSRRGAGGRHVRRRRQLSHHLEFQHGARSDRAHQPGGGAFAPWP